MHLGLLNARHTAGGSLFGDGTYSQNIFQDGAILQPQASYTWERKVPITSLLTPYGPTAFNAVQLTDGILVDSTGFYTTVEAGKCLVLVDAGVGKTLLMSRMRRYGMSRAIGEDNWAVMYSDDMQNWTEVASLIRAHGDVNTWVDAYWDSSVHGSHRYWCTYQRKPHAPQTWQVEEEWYEGGTVKDAIVVTNPAVVIRDAGTLSCVVKCKNLVLNGPNARLNPSAYARGMYMHLSGNLVCLNGALLQSYGKGEAVIGPQSEVEVLPASLKKGLSLSKLSVRKLANPGGAGGAAGPGSGPSYNLGTVGGTGGAGVGLQGGGGGGGGSGKYSVNLPAGRGGKGTPWVGGGGGGGGPRHYSGGVAGGDANDNGGGGRGGGNTQGNGGGGGGGAGDPVGTPYPGDGTPGNPGTGPGGGPLLAYVFGNVFIGPGSRVTTKGSDGGRANIAHGGGGGGGGGGPLGIFYHGTYTNHGTVDANGGLGGLGGAQEAGNYAGGPGGPGGITVQKI